MDLHTFDAADNEKPFPSSRQRRILFSLGQVVATPGAIELLSRYSLSAFAFLVRHATGDWGCVCPDDALENERAVKNGCRILSAYEIVTGEHLWCITEWDRSVTTLLMPSEY